MISCGKTVVVFLFFLTPNFSFADQLKLRAIDTHGKPLVGNVVLVTFFRNDERIQKLELKTDANGEGNFSIPAPVPTRILVAVVPKTGQHWRCNWRGTCGISLNPEEALQNGIAYYESQKRAKLKANPGEILFIARRWTFWQYLIGPFAS